MQSYNIFFNPANYFRKIGLVLVFFGKSANSCLHFSVCMGLLGAFCRCFWCVGKAGNGIFHEDMGYIGFAESISDSVETKVFVEGNGFRLRVQA